MQYVRFGNTGIKVSRLCLGTMTYGDKQWREWVLEEKDSFVFFKRAWEHGINFYDTANVYSWGVCEEIVGRALKQLGRRDEYVLATKVRNPVARNAGINQQGLSRKHIMDQIDASLRRLGTDHVDLYIIHRWDYGTPIEETMEALHDVVKAGKARYIGASSMHAWQFAKAQYTARLNGWTRFVSMQNHYNLIYREEEREMIPFCRDQGCAITPWSPLARGFLAGNRSRENITGNKAGETSRSRSDEIMHRYYYQDQDFDIVGRVVETALKRGTRPIQVALAWLLQKPWITSPIIGASKLEQLDELVAGIELKLDDTEVKYLEEPYEAKAVAGAL